MSSVKYDSWEAALTAWREHLPCAEAEASGGLCLCRYAYPCPTCGSTLEAIGEDMDGLQELEGRCARCFMAAQSNEEEEEAAEEPVEQSVDDSWVDDLFSAPPTNLD